MIQFITDKGAIKITSPVIPSVTRSCKRSQLNTGCTKFESIPYSMFSVCVYVCHALLFEIAFPGEGLKCNNVLLLQLVKYSTWLIN